MLIYASRQNIRVAVTYSIVATMMEIKAFDGHSSLPMNNAHQHFLVPLFDNRNDELNLRVHFV